MLDAHRTLVLDASYRPIQAVGWRRAMVLDLLDRVDVLEYYDSVVRTANDAFPLPAVIRLRNYVQRHRRALSLTRRNLLVRDQGSCQYCGESPSLKELTIDHVLPKSRGGPSTWQNLVIACGPCNRRKGNRTPSEAHMPLRRSPRVPDGIAFGKDGFHVSVPDQWVPYLPR